MDYTTLVNVKTTGKIGANPALSNPDDTEISGIITAVSREIDDYTLQQWTGATASIIYNPIVDRDGVATIWTDVPIINSLTALTYRDPTRSSTSSLNGSLTWQTGIDLVNSVETIQNVKGCRIKVYSPDFSGSRNTLQMQVTMNYGYVDQPTLQTALPEFELVVRRIALWTYVQRNVSMEVMSQGQDGVKQVPTKWPTYLVRSLDRYARTVPNSRH